MISRPSLIVLIAFISGILTTVSLAYIADYPSHNYPITTTTYAVNTPDRDDGTFITRILGADENQEQPSPYDWVGESKIEVGRDRVVIYINNPVWSRFTDTNSMDPVIDVGSNAIQIVPQKEADIHVGDIISYESEYAEGIIIHRVIDMGYDDDGWYAIAKGDNNPRADPGKIRYAQIKRILIAVIY